MASTSLVLRFAYAMPHKHVLFESDAREKVLRGASALANAVKVTLGPKSKCVLIEKKWGTPLVCVVRIALENAVSVASVLLLTEATLTEVPAPRAEYAPPPQ